MPRRTPKRPSPETPFRANVEWIGGRVELPFYLGEGNPERPHMLLWLEAPTGLLVGSRLIDPSTPARALVESLRDTMRQPLAGPPRKPARIRVADAADAKSVSAAVGEAIEVSAAPTPELDGIIASLLRHMKPLMESEKLPFSYLEQGRVSPEAMAHLFESAGRLYQAAPWTVAHDGQLLHLTVEELGVRESVISIIGGLGQSLGLILFESVDAFEAFVADADKTDAALAAGGAVDLGSSTLALDFSRAAETPKSMIAEVKEHGWPLPARGMYPAVVRRDRDATPRPLEERDVRLCAVAADAVARFWARHVDLFDEDSTTPASETIEVAHGGVRWSARISGPHLLEQPDGEDVAGTGALAPELLARETGAFLHPRDDWRASSFSPSEIASRSGRPVDEALDFLERVLAKPKTSRLEAGARLLGISGARLNREQRQRATELYARLVDSGGNGVTFAEEGLLKLLASHPDESLVGFWRQTLALKTRSGSFTVERRRIVVNALGMIARAVRSSSARAVLLETVAHEHAAVRAEAIAELAALIAGERLVSADLVAAFESAAHGDSAFKPRFLARQALTALGRGPIRDVPGGTMTFRVTPRFAVSFSLRIELRSDDTLATLHNAIQDALRWDDDHLYSFFMSGSDRDREAVEFSREEEPSAADAIVGEIGIVPGAAFTYVFDFGDHHEFEVVLVASSPKADARKSYPRVAEKKGRPPAQYGRW